MAKRICIRGMIVDSSYDDEWCAAYISNGVLTPESAFRRQLAEAGGDEVEIYVSSQGGDVVAGNEILNAIRSYAGPKSIVVGAFAASMAANIVISAGCPVKCYRNSILLYHGAWGVAIGGSGAMKDEAHVLELINAPIKAALKEHGVPDETVEEGFAEGREFTMGADEAKEYGIVTEIIDGDGEAPARVTGDAAAALTANAAALPIAAFAWQDAVKAESTDEDGDGSPAETEDGDAEETPADGGNTETATEGGDGEEPPAETEDAENADGEDTDGDDEEHPADGANALAAARAEINRLRAMHDSTVKALNGQIDAFRQQAERMRTEHAARIKTLNEQLARSRNAHAALVGNVLAPRESTPATWKDAVAKHGLEAAARLFPNLASDYRKALRNKH